MFRKIIMTTAALFICLSTAWSVETKTACTQKEFAQLIFQQFSWDGGLPTEPTDRDYLLILGGKRTFRYEAENAYNEKTDRVTMREHTLYGPFTGKGWLLGVSDTTVANFSTLVPIKGEYTLKAVIKGNGFVWNIDNKDYRADSQSGNFREIEIGKMSLKAGVVKIKVSIPPEGAIDSFSMSAADLAPIQPLAGWRFRDPLTAGRMAEIAVSMSGRYLQLPESSQDTPRTLAVSEVARLPSTATPTHIAYLGSFASREWVRADYHGATLQIPIKIAATGFYGITAHVLGERITGSVNEVPFEVAARPYLDKAGLGLFRLESGDNLITINLPPMGGIDTVEFSRKSTSPDDFLKLADIKGPADRLITADEATAVLKTIMDSYPVRK